MIVTPNRPGRSGCPIASTLDLVGDRWTMVLVRDMLTGKARYAEFLASPARITTNVNGGGTMHDAESPGGPVAAAQEMRHSWSLVGCDEGQEMYSVEFYAAVRLAVVDAGLSHHEAGSRGPCGRGLFGSCGSR